MSRSVNRIHLIGHVGRNPDVRVTQGGTKVANFTVATNRRAKEGEAEQTDWHRVTVWKQQAEFAENYVRQGDRVYVEGRLEYGSYQRDGVTIPTAEITAMELVLLTSKNNRDASADDMPATVKKVADAFDAEPILF